MPHTQSAKKNLRKSEKRRMRNRATKKGVRTHLKSFTTALTAITGTPQDEQLKALQAEYNLAAKRLDKAAARGVIHRNMAARKKSQMARAINEKKASPSKPTA